MVGGTVVSWTGVRSLEVGRTDDILYTGTTITRVVRRPVGHSGTRLLPTDLGPMEEGSTNEKEDFLVFSPFSVVPLKLGKLRVKLPEKARVTSSWLTRLMYLR